MSARRSLAARLAALAVVLMVLASSPDAFGHAAFVGSTPAPGQELDVAPRAIALSFTEPLNRQLSRATLVSVETGRKIPIELRVRDARRFAAVPQRPLSRGAYRVRWHTVSTEDGHALEGSFSFGVQASAAGVAHDVEESPLARAGWLRVGLRGAFYGAVLMLAAALLLPLLVRPAGRSWLAPRLLSAAVDVGRVRAREARVTDALAWFSVGTAVAVTVAEAADAAGSLSPDRLGAFLLGNEAGAARVLIVVCLLACALVWRRRPRLGALLAVLALAAVAGSGHASSASPRVLSVANDWLHLVSAGVWLGGVALIVLVWSHELRRGDPAVRLAVARHVLPGFGRVAIPAFALVSMTGALSLFTQLGHLDALWTTSYGRLLAVKIALVGLIAAVSATHALRLRPRLLAAEPQETLAGERRHWRLLRGEPALGFGVVGVVALLVAFPLPPRQLGEADEARVAVPACDPCPLRRPAANELAVAEQVGSQLVAAWVRRTPEGLAGTLRVLDYRGRPSPAVVELPGTRSRGCGVGCQQFSAPTQASAVEVRLRDRGRTYGGKLPTRWRDADNRVARRLLLRAQAAMR
ncbi:MAG: CopD family protein, partial [Actinomycetota bacterium]|nr:CopD family protein [Actinomycetota bacterium]